MIIECCNQSRTYLKFFGQLGQRFCLIRVEFQVLFDALFQQYVGGGGGG
jgi:pre-mRNA-splicing factor CWC22